MNHELDALTVIKATIMLQWYTPVGPEEVSYDAGEFWLRVGVAIALQIGLHREPPRGPTASVRKRVWWTLRVSPILSQGFLPLTRTIDARRVDDGRPRSASGD